MKVTANIKDADGLPVEVTTASPDADRKPLVMIDHGGHTFCVDAAAMIAAIVRARVNMEYPDEIPF